MTKTQNILNASLKRNGNVDSAKRLSLIYNNILCIALQGVHLNNIEILHVTLGG